MIRKYFAHNSLLSIYLAWKLEPNSANYHLNFSYQIKNRNAVELLVNKIQELIQLKAYLRQTFSLEGEELITSIHDDLPAETSFHTVAISNFQKLEQELIKKPLDINRKSPVRVGIIHLEDDNSYCVLISIHHIVMDGISLDRFIQDLNCLLNGSKIEIESTDDYLMLLHNEVPLQDGDENNVLTSYFSGIKQAVSESDNVFEEKRSDTLHYTAALPTKLTEKLNVFSEQLGISRFNLLLLSYGIFLTKLLDQEQILINYPVNIRTNKNINGCFLNMVTALVHPKTRDTYLSMIHSWKNVVSTLKQASKIKLSNKMILGISPSFSSLTVTQLQNLLIDGISYEAKSYSQIAHANISLKYREKKEDLYFACDTYSTMFPSCVSSSLLLRFFNYLNKLLENPKALLKNIDLTFTEEKRKILYEFNDASAYCPNDTLINLFEKQATKTPDNIAIVDSKRTVSYIELSINSKLLAKYLIGLIKETGLHGTSIIGILSEKGYNQVISALAIMNSGCGYLPLNIDWPMGRLKEILEQGNVSVILISRDQFQLEKIKKPLSERYLLLVIEDILDSINNDKNLQDELNQLYLPKIKSNDIAYVIFTSGSTGKPKGVTISHHGALNTIYAINKRFKVKSIDKVLALSEFSFDLSVYDIFGLLAVGGAIVFPEQKRVKEPKHWLNLIGQYKITIWNSVPQLASLLMDVIKYNSCHNLCIKLFLLSGDWIPTHLPSRINEKFPKSQIVSLGGATEGSIWSIWYDIKKVDPQWNKIPYGLPMPNQKMYVLTQDGGHAVIGAIGEIYIGGAGVALNYYNDKEKTELSFIDHYELGRLYKTGDLGRWHEDGYMEFMGRKDNQVKIHGYRIELEEISAKIDQITGVDDAVTQISIKNKVPYIVSFYTGKRLNEEEIKSYLKSYLPEYMIPVAIIHLTRFPLTINGKIDNKRLPEPKFENDKYEEPSNEQERFICKEFSKILDIEKVGVNDDFFKLGGSSLKAIRLVSILQNNFSIKAVDMFNLRTPKKLAKNLQFDNEFFRKKLETIKAHYQNKQSDSSVSDEQRDKIKHYLSSIRDLKFDLTLKKPITNILLTGATGYLGCNLLHQLLKLTNYNIFLLVRADTQEEAFNRVKKKFQYYFDEKLDEFYGVRVFVIRADIEKNNFGLLLQEYQILATEIDCIIHAAALVKHYGEYEKFYSANVNATIHLLEFTRLTKYRDFHYISTVSVFSSTSSVSPSKLTIFTEDDSPKNSETQGNIYIKTKIEAENQVILYRKHGVYSTIYRVGNLAFIAANGRAQENREEHAFSNRIKCLLKLGVISPEIGFEEISPVDLTAKAIIKLFDKEELSNRTCHVFNPNKFSLMHFFSKEYSMTAKNVPFDQLVDCVISQLSDQNNRYLAEKFLLHQGWLDDDQLQQEKILQDRTEHILKKLNFEWLPITDELFHSYLQNVYS